VPGSIRSRGPNSWQLRVYAGIDASSGRKRWVTRTVRGSEREARRALKRFLEDADNARVYSGSVTDLLDRWFAAASTDWSASTIRETRSLIEHHLKLHLGHLSVAKLTTADIDDFYAYLRRAGGRDAAPLAPGTVHRVHVVLHRALQQAVRWEWVWTNPAANASPPRYVPPEIRPPTAEEVRELIAAASSTYPALGVFFLLAATTGARRGELLALRWCDVDLAAGALCFQRSLVEGDHGPVLAPTKTRRTHRVALDEASKATLSQLYEDAVATLGESFDPGRFVFPRLADGSEPWRPNWVTKSFIRARKAAGLPHFRLHDLRHFMATEMLNDGIAIAVVASRLAHARASTTLNVYAHAVPGGDHDAAERLAARLVGGSRARGVSPSTDDTSTREHDGSAPRSGQLAIQS
jgi:integrase